MYLFLYFFLYNIGRKISNNKYFFDVTTYVWNHKRNITFPHAEFMLNQNSLSLQSVYDLIPSFSENVWFKTKYAQELKDLNITSNYSTYGNVIYYDLLTNYVKLSKQLEDQIDHFSNEFFVSDLLIGLQIRTGKMPDRTERGAAFYRVSPSRYINEALRIREGLLSINITSKMYISIFIVSNPL